MRTTSAVIGIVAICALAVAVFIGVPALLHPGDGLPPTTPTQTPTHTPTQTPTLPVPTTKPPNTIVVAAADSSQRYREWADFICDGIDDHEEIDEAFGQLPRGGTVLLTDGTFNIRGSILPPSYSTLKGAGPDSTILNFTAGDAVALAKSSYVTLSHFRITGNGRIYITTSHNRLEYIQAYRLDDSYICAFMLYANNKVVEDIEFYRCQVIDCNRWGFVHSGENKPNRISNVTYLECEAINCGRYGQYYGERNQYTEAWDVGFNLGEVLDTAENIRYIDCTARGCWESGFHVEAPTVLRNIQYVNCTSENNGQKKNATGDVDFGAGFIVDEGMTLTDCVSIANPIGYLCQDTGGTLVRCTDRESAVGYQILSITRGLSLSSCTALDSERPILIWTGPTRRITIDGLRIRSSTPKSGAAIFIDPLAQNPDGILVSNSSIDGYSIGVQNMAYERGNVRVRNVTVSGTDRDFVHCTVSA